MKYTFVLSMLAGADAVLIHIKDDPICNSAGCTQYLHPQEDKYPKDYYVADFGLDEEVRASQSHEKAAEGTFKHKWNPKWDEEDEKFMDMPTASASFSLVQLGDEPISGSGLKKNKPICTNWVSFNCVEPENLVQLH